jgi:hypothetical protein
MPVHAQSLIGQVIVTRDSLFRTTLDNEHFSTGYCSDAGECTTTSSAPDDDKVVRAAIWTHTLSIVPIVITDLNLCVDETILDNPRVYPRTSSASSISSNRLDIRNIFRRLVNQHQPVLNKVTLRKNLVFLVFGINSVREVTQHET